MAPLKCVITVALFLIAIHINVCLAQEVEKPSTARDKGALAVQGTWLWQHKGKNKSTTCELTIAKKEGMFHCVLKAGKKQYESKKGLLINGVFTVTFSVADSDKKYSFRGKLNKGKMTGENLMLPVQAPSRSNGSPVEPSRCKGQPDVGSSFLKHPMDRFRSRHLSCSRLRTNPMLSLPKVPKWIFVKPDIKTES